SEEICEALVAMEGRAEYGKSAKPISKNQLAKRLKRFKIIPDSVRIGVKTPKGYYRHQFQEAWDRYLSPTPQETPSETQHRNNLDEMGTSVAFQSATEKGVLRFKNSEKPLSNGHCCVVADANAVLAGEGKNNIQKCAQCGKDGADLEAYYGEASAWLHRGACQDAWTDACDADDLAIPSYLDRRPGARA